MSHSEHGWLALFIWLSATGAACQAMCISDMPSTLTTLQKKVYLCIVPMSAYILVDKPKVNQQNDYETNTANDYPAVGSVGIQRLQR